MKTPLILAATIAMAGIAPAAVVSFNTSFGPSTIGAAQFSVSLPKFNPALGFLTSVKITLDASTTSNILLFDNEAGSPGTVDLDVGTTVTAAAPLLTAAVATPLQTGSGSVDADNDLTADFTGTDSFGIAGGVGTDSDAQSGASAPIFAAYTAAFLGETFSTTIDNSIFTGTQTSGIFGPTLPTAGTFSGTVTVDYTYTIPEPSSAALIGLVGAGVLLRRRRN